MLTNVCASVRKKCLPLFKQHANSYHMQDDSDADYSYFESQCSEVCVRNIHAYIVVEVLPENQIS